MVLPKLIKDKGATKVCTLYQDDEFGLEVQRGAEAGLNSVGMELTENRLLLLNKYAAVHSSVEIIDLKNEEQEALGTKVILKIPFGE